MAVDVRAYSLVSSLASAAVRFTGLSTLYSYWGKTLAAILGTADFYAPLTTSLVLEKGTGQATFTRGTTATVEVNDGANGLILKTAKIGEARFPGARRVENLLQKTATLATQSVTVVSGYTYTLSFWGTGSVALSGAYTGALAGTGTENRVQSTFTSTSTTLTLTVTGSVTSAQLENVTGQAVQTAGEYVSNGAIRRNLLTYSEQFDNAAWEKTLEPGTSVAVNQAVAPDGTMTADKIVYNGSGTAGGIRIYGNIGTSQNGTSYISTFYIRADAQVSVAIGQNLGTTKTINVTTEWQRFNTNVVIGNGIGWIMPRILSAPGDNSPFTLYVWGAQAEIGSTPTAYQKVTDAGPLDFNNFHGLGVDGVKAFPTLRDGTPIPDAMLKGVLVEGSRTNLLLNSAVLATQNVSVTAQAYTLSFTGTGSVTLSGAYSGSLVGTGANNRVSITFTPTAGTLTCTVSGSVTLGQLEAGDFPSSYIPTTGATVTRNADVLAYPTAGNVNAAEGSIYMEATSTDTVSTKYNRIVEISDGSEANKLSILKDGLSGNIGKPYSSIISNSIDQGIPARGLSDALSSNPMKLAMAWGKNRHSFASKGRLLGTDTTVNTPVSLNQINIGSQYSGASSGILFGTIRNARVWKSVLADSDLQSITK